MKMCVDWPVKEIILRRAEQIDSEIVKFVRKLLFFNNAIEK